MEAGLKDAIASGLILQGTELYVDLSYPRTVMIQAFNELTGIKKAYILKVTEKGLCLV